MKKERNGTFITLPYCDKDASNLYIVTKGRTYITCDPPNFIEIGNFKTQTILAKKRNQIVSMSYCFELRKWQVSYLVGNWIVE